MALYCGLIDDYDHTDDNLEYILENVLSEETIGSTCTQLKELYNTLLLNKCVCDEHDICSSCPHGGNYVYDEKSQELVINPAHMSDLIYECTSLCNCKVGNCHNRLIQYGPRKNLKIVYSNKYQSKGVITTKDIPQGAFICEYAGELLTRAEAMKRISENEKNHKMNYVLCLKENSAVEKQEPGKGGVELMTIVDPSKKGNIGRYLNHSCQPNCQIFSARLDCPVPKIAIFSKRVIIAGEELCFHYNDGKQFSTPPCSGKVTPCLCNFEKCEQFLPNLEI